MNHLWKKVLLSLIVTAGLINPTQSSCMFRRLKQFFSTPPEKIIANNELKSNDRTERYKLLYQLLTMMPPEMIRMILDYESCPLKSMCEQTSSTLLICDFKQLYRVNVDHEITAWNSKSKNMQLVNVKGIGKLLKCSQGRLLWVSADGTGTILMLDPTATHEVQILNDTDKWDIFNLGSIAEDTFVASALSNDCEACELQFWNIDQKVLSFRQPTKYPTKHHTKITQHVFALVTGESNDTIELWYWDAPTKTARRVKKIKLGTTITSLAHLSDGNLAAGLKTGETKIQSPLDGTLKAILKGHEHSVGAMMQLPNGKLATKSYANEMKMWG